jgi:DNA-binding XRE family transcriptional regulator
MARKLNLYVPTISECTIQRSGTEVQKVDNAKLLEDKVSRNFQSSASLRMVRENLAKTSEIMRKTLGQDTNQPSEKNEKTHDDLVKEILVLKKKVAQLEKDK